MCTIIFVEVCRSCETDRFIATVIQLAALCAMCQATKVSGAENGLTYNNLASLLHFYILGNTVGQHSCRTQVTPTLADLIL